MNFRILTLLTLFVLPLSLATPVQAQDAENVAKITVYLDCRGCNETFIRDEIGFVDFVRDQSAANIHLLITRQGTGSGGRQYTLNFLGQDELEEQSFEVLFSTSNSDTDDEIRDELVRQIKIGMLPYLSGNRVLNDISILYSPSGEEEESVQAVDPWNNWVFEFGASTWFSGEESRKNLNLYGDVSARRITDNWKTEFRYDYGYNRRTFVSEDSLGNKEEDVYTTERQSFFSLIARSLSDHWTTGVYTRVNSSTRDNYDLRIAATPSVEYSVFPYREYASREITFRYGILTTYNDYTETTIFGEDQELLLRQELASRLEFTQPWGQIEGRMNAYSYLHDLSKNRFDFRFEIDFRVTRNLSVFLSTRYSVINDQINIAAGDTSDEELLLNLRQQSTSYSYGGSVGFEITFGSIYNNVVNPRF